MMAGLNDRHVIAALFLVMLSFISCIEVRPRLRGPSKIDITEPCQYPVALGLEKRFIPDSSLWSTSQMNSARAAHLARLKGWIRGNRKAIHGRYEGGGAWTSGVPNNLQYLGVDVGLRQVITGVATQGRRGSREYVTEYFLEFSSDNITWTVYTNQYGTPFMFDGNTNDNGIVRNDFPYPIVARYIRINPQRWNLFISLRLELYGCKFVCFDGRVLLTLDGEGVTFNGQSRITYDIGRSMQFVQSRSDNIKLRFRTSEANGVLLFADGNQGDYILLELVRGRLYLNIDLGSTALVAGDTFIRAGSLLDDNQWHDVEIVRKDRSVDLTVDRLTITNITNGDFYQLDLDRAIQLGGIDNFIQPGKRIQSKENFTGCMENVWFNYANLIQDARTNRPRYRRHGSVMFGACQNEPIMPFTFPTIDAYLEFDGPTDKRLRVSFDFRSYNRDGLLFMHKLDPQPGRFMIKLNKDGLLEYSIRTVSDPEVTNILSNRDPMAEAPYFTDGLWHRIMIDITPTTTTNIGHINITVDSRSEISNRHLSFTTTTKYYIGGGDVDGGETGFLGCMRKLVVQGEPKEKIDPISNKGGVLNGTCSVQDRCDPNPCEHMALCSQNYNTFSCDCLHTGYEGAVCHKSKYLVSCEEAMMLNPMLPEMKIFIDIDDSGLLDPFPVKCVFQNQLTSTTELYHDSGDEIVVDGFSEPGSYVRPIRYDAPEREQLDALIARAYTCDQYIKYTCYQSKLLSDAGSSDPSVPSWGWWVGRTNQIERYWGGSSPGSGMCSCALKNECKSLQSSGQSTNKCNCDSGLAQDDVFDDGYLEHKENLPVMELRFGDTGTIFDEKYGKHLLGPLRCEGDTMFDNIITFRKEDATIEFPTFDAATSGDVRLQFKTTAMSGVLLQNTGRFDFIELRLVLGNIMQLRFDVGNGVQTIDKETAYPLNDDSWHTVHFERNRKQAMLRVDQQAPVILDEPTDQNFRTLNLASPLVVGAAVDYSDGFVGCLRALLVNGVVMDLRGKVERGEVTYGVAPGCEGKCASSPCFNNGICIEWYSYYQCDCAYTPYRGWDCGREMGVNMLSNYMIKYGLDQETGSISTDEEQIIIGFSTQEKKGTLMYIRNSMDIKNEYISVEVNNNGGVKVIVDVGFERDEVNTNIQDVDLCNNQQHVVDVKRSNKGRTITLKVDNYPPMIKTWDLPPNTDTRLDNPQFIYFGRNESTREGDGFKGCLFRAQFDNLFPISRVFQDPRPSNIYLEGDIKEDMCGFEEVTRKPEVSEVRPTPPLSPDLTTLPPAIIDDYGVLSPNEIALLAGCLVLGFLLIVAVAALFLYYYLKQKHQYVTLEAEDAQYFDNPDYAIAAGLTTQPELQKTREFLL